MDHTEKKIHVDVLEIELRFTPTPPDDPDYNAEREAAYLKWWDEIGQHSNYLRASLTDTRGDTPMRLNVQSPTFPREDLVARESNHNMLQAAIDEAIEHRLANAPI